jgi:hypothetical protein
MSKKYSSFKKQQSITENFRRFLREEDLTQAGETRKNRGDQWDDWTKYSEETKNIIEKMDFVFGDILSKDSAIIKHITKLSKGDAKALKLRKSILVSGDRLLDALKSTYRKVQAGLTEDMSDAEMDKEIQSFTNLQSGGELLATIEELPALITSYIENSKAVSLRTDPEDGSYQYGRIQRTMPEDMERELRELAYNIQKYL